MDPTPSATTQSPGSIAASKLLDGKELLLIISYNEVYVISSR